MGVSGGGSSQGRRCSYLSRYASSKRSSRERKSPTADDRRLSAPLGKGKGVLTTGREKRISPGAIKENVIGIKLTVIANFVRNGIDLAENGIGRMFWHVFFFILSRFGFGVDFARCERRATVNLNR